ncbi:MAG: DUF4433 domain-containing protein [Tildeniella torsiva UHER 1998/13D]|jgi:hypothetical protein|nr:DUF4433 domain-containing protein [Tildeniella torsiva UHER 1998/13D]
MTVPAQPKIYHIVHVDRLPSIIADACLWCDAEVLRRSSVGTTIGMSKIKQRRLNELTLTSHPELHVGDCVPFYFCPRSIMLYLIYRKNSELAYSGGQGPIVHLQADLHTCVAWTEQQKRRWAFTLTNAGAYYFEDRCDLAQLNEINWAAVQAGQWQSCREGKQAEFLIEHSFPWQLVERIGVHSRATYQQVMEALPAGGHRPPVEIKTDWYYG